VRYVTPREARAIREDAASATGNCGRKRIGTEKRHVGPHRIHLRLGEPPVRDVAHMPRDEFFRSLDLSKIHVTRRPRCRACRGLIEPGRAIAFSMVPESGRGPGSTAFLHETCP